MRSILYLHGFRSAPASFKAQVLAREMANRGLSHAWHCPQLPASPKEAVALALSIAHDILKTDTSGNASSAGQGAMDTPDRLTIIGSSLGGYYATWLAETLGCRAILLNPAVHAARALATQVGEHKQFHSDQPFVFLPEYVQELQAMWVPTLTRLDRYFLIAATGDEVLDWRDMAARYAGARQHIVDGGDHGLSDFDPLLPLILEAAGLSQPT